MMRDSGMFERLILAAAFSLSKVKVIISMRPASFHVPHHVLRPARIFAPDFFVERSC